MFNIGAGELAVILVVALIVLGPQRLPELARGIGKFMREFRRQTDDVRNMVEREFYRMDEEFQKPSAATPVTGAAPEDLHEGLLPGLPSESTGALAAEATGVSSAETTGVPSAETTGASSAEATSALPADPAATPPDAVSSAAGEPAQAGAVPRESQAPSSTRLEPSREGEANKSGVASA